MRTLVAGDVSRAVTHLPSLRPVVTRLLASFDDPGIDTQTLVHEIAQDQALSLRVLRLSNSSFYGLSSHVESLRDAVMVLGFRTVRAATIAIAVTDCFIDHHVEGFDQVAFWKHCAATGLVARELAKLVHQPTDIAFTAGIIHDTGFLALMSQHPQETAEVLAYCRSQQCLLHEGELEIFAVDHAQIGAALARHWELPESLALAVAHHLHPEEAEAKSLADVVHVADAVVQAYGLVEFPGSPVMPLSDLALNRLGLKSSDLAGLISRLDADLEPTFQALFCAAK